MDVAPSIFLPTFQTMFRSVTVSDVPVEVNVLAEGYVSKAGDHFPFEQSCNFLRAFVPFQEWLKKAHAAFGEGFRVVRVLSIYPFASTSTDDPKVKHPRPIGFAFVDADIFVNGKPVPGAGFLRGGSVAILPVLKAQETGEEFTLLTCQARVPKAEKRARESPAGMLDGVKKKFAGVAAKEMEEETGLIFAEEELEYLGIMDPSMGGCDEDIRMFRGVKVMPAANIAELKGKLTGADENEAIVLEVLPMADFVKACLRSEIKDAKAKCLLFHHLLAAKTAAATH